MAGILKLSNEIATEEGITLGKGLSRRVIVVDSPDPHIFEQAIFIVRNDAAVGSGGSPPSRWWTRPSALPRIMPGPTAHRPGGGCVCPRGWRPCWGAAIGAVWLLAMLL